MLGGRGSPLRGQNRTLLAASCIRISNSRRHHSTRLNLSDFVDLRKGDALALPLEDRSVDVAAQNCLFNIFRERDLARALTEMYRVLKPHGRLVLSDPVCEQAMPATLRNDDRLRAMCLSGAIPLDDYLAQLTEIGFGTIEVRARRPYRVLAPSKYATSKLIYIESVEVCAIKDPMPADGPCIFTGRTAIYFGDQDYFDDGKGHVMQPNQPLAVCDKTARALWSARMRRSVRLRFNLVL